MTKVKEFNLRMFKTALETARRGVVNSKEAYEHERDPYWLQSEEIFNNQIKLLEKIINRFENNDYPLDDIMVFMKNSKKGLERSQKRMENEN